MYRVVRFDEDVRHPWLVDSGTAVNPNSACRSWNGTAKMQEKQHEYMVHTLDIAWGKP